ncbi:DUF4258 domain-containing protein [Pseudomonas fluorescens]
MSRQLSGNFDLTRHAIQRMQQRGISTEQIEAVLAYGRTVQEGRVVRQMIGRNEVAQYSREGINLSSMQGVHLVLADDGSVITAFRSQSLRRYRAPRRRPVAWR